MVSNNAINSFIVANCIPRSKLDNYFFVAISVNNSFSLIKRKNIIRIGVEFKFSIKLRVVGNREDFV